MDALQGLPDTSDDNLWEDFTTTFETKLICECGNPLTIKGGKGRRMKGSTEESKQKLDKALIDGAIEWWNKQPCPKCGSLTKTLVQ